ncbi:MULTISPECIES: M20 aminoacylase family protein [unclassified Devosia]|jgi:amidohydrolase|uniref:M20 aminoacylase family protein n=1 Tax=unclassified Devosia TaxID=196773 RepID=UPI00086AB161|nr:MULTISPECIES: M20 aminoacylase family protein [unclassified Devosia]MBN9360576.1 amidohydrolase [Devosia sp.]ODS85453.1 MAG: amidohydrolase [Devosia sp. SCN 66-27]OJX22562.1 MAG: amidohydrolase [Devosia sp. 66-14]
MPVINRIAEFADEVAEWRRDFHVHPELQYDLPRTSGKVADLLRSFGVDEVVTGIAQSGVVGVIRGRGPGKTIGIRADMDALPILERTGLDYASQTPGRMHACGHDGHTAILLGTAKYLAETRNFDGNAVMIFQPAEEGGAGGRAMVEAGIMDRFGVDEVYGLHNMPGQDAGSIAMRVGGLMAASDEFNIVVEGQGGHAAWPQNTVDPVMITAQLITALHTIVSRDIDPIRSAVLSVTMMQGGEAFNIIPQKVKLTGTVRSLNDEVRDLMEERLKAVTKGIVETFGGKAEVTYRRGYPVVENTPDETAYAAAIAATVVGEDRVDANVDPKMGGEDFSYMLQARPGAYVFLGNGPSSELHSDTYNFNDEIIPVGVSFFVKLVEGASQR